ncbi:MAG: cytochrome c [Devosiaceae bacterium]|nr:cytochrome c [Devosiaceae bacterium]
MKKSDFANAIAIFSLLLIPGAAFSSPSTAGAAPHVDADAIPHEGVEVELQIPEMNAERGRELFATKGCASCHAVNGIGGIDASPLDAHNMDAQMNPFELAAKMWAMAPFMIAAQEDEMGAQILFTGQELADIVAFLHNDSEQHKFTDEYLDSLGIDIGHGPEG